MSLKNSEINESGSELWECDRIESQENEREEGHITQGTPLEIIYTALRRFR